MSKPTKVSLSCCPAQIYRSKNCLWDPTSLCSKLSWLQISLTSFLYSLPKGMLEHQLPAAAKHLLHSPSIPIIYVFICQSNDKIVFRSSLIGAFTLRRAKNLLWATQQREVLTQTPSQQTLRTTVFSQHHIARYVRTRSEHSWVSSLAGLPVSTEQLLFVYS